MIIQPKVRGFICTTAHPTGCYQEVLSQVNYVQTQQRLDSPKSVLIIGASTGYGLASRIVAAFGAGAKTIGVFYERPADDKRTATPGWYNTSAFEHLAHNKGLYAKSINGDAFSEEIKQQTIHTIKQDLGKIDLLIYSLASPRRHDSISGHVYSSVLKPIGQPFTSKTVDPFRAEVKDITLNPATEEEINETIKVMGGEDWERWVSLLQQEKLLANGFKTVAYSYIGPQLTHAIYKQGTIGKAKDHLHQTAIQLAKQLADVDGRALISVNKALVTQASAAIPVVPLYISLLYKLMKQKGTHEGCIQQIYRLYKDYLSNDSQCLKADSLIRIDDLEMDVTIQSAINKLWPTITTDNIMQQTDLEGYRNEFYKLFGFGQTQIDYNKPVNPKVDIPSLAEELIKI